MPNPWEMDWSQPQSQAPQGNSAPWKMDWSGQGQSEGLGQKVLSAIGTGAKALDSVTGAPVRAAISAVQNGQNPITAGWNQFGNMTDQAPSGKDIALKAGLSDEPSPTTTVMRGGMGGVPTPVTSASNATAAGMGIDMAANPLNLAGPLLKMVGKVGEAAAPLSESLDTFANDRALKAAGFMKKDFNIIQAKGTQDALGNLLLNDKIVTPFATLSKISDRISEAKQAAGQTIGHILDTADSSGAPAISAKDIALKLSEDPEIKTLATTPGQEGTANQVNKFIQTLYNHPEGDGLSLRDAQELRQGIDTSINFNKTVPEMRGAQPYLFKMRDAVSQAMNDSVNALQGGGDIDRLKMANASYSKLATLDKVAQNRLGALSSNEQFSLGDKVAAGVGAVAGHGNPMTAVGIGALNKTARAVGNSLAATGAKKLSSLIPDIPETVGNLPSTVGPAVSTINRSVMPSTQVLPAAAQGQPNTAQAPQPSQTIQPQRGPSSMPNPMPSPGFVPPQAQPTQQSSQDKLGPDKWASDGFHNLKGHVNDQDREFLEKHQDALMVDKNAKQLLITAQSYEPGSKPLDDIMKHLKKQFGEK